MILADSADGTTWKARTVIPFLAVDSKTNAMPEGAPAEAIPAFPITDPYSVGLCATSRDPHLQRLPGFNHLTGFSEGMASHVVYSAGGRFNW